MTVIERADFLWNVGRRREAIRVLEDYIPTVVVDIVGDNDGEINYVYKSRWLPEVINKLRVFHYACAQYVDPAAGLKAAPEDAMGRATRKSGNFVAASNRWSCRDAPAERLEQIPRRPGPK